MGIELVKAGYNRMAKRYLAGRHELKSDKYVRKLIKLLPKRAQILDVGCGAGVPVDDLLLKAGHEVVGIDISEEMIKLARRNCPSGEYVVRDMRELTKGEYQVEAIVSMYAMFHVPRFEQERVLAVMAGNLVDKGLILLTMGDVEFEGEHELYGERVWSSQWGRRKNREMLEKIGFKIELDELDCSGGERHQVLIGRKRRLT